MIPTRKSSQESRGTSSHTNGDTTNSSAVPIPFEVKPELEDVVLELASEPLSVGILPLPVDDLEGDVLVGGASGEAKNGEITVVGIRSLKREEGGRNIL